MICKFKPSWIISKTLISDSKVNMNKQISIRNLIKMKKELVDFNYYTVATIHFVACNMSAQTTDIDFL